MAEELATKLLALGASLAAALAAIWWLTRHERRRVPRALLAGFPEREFPQGERLHASLASLRESQASLLVLYRRLPPTEPARATLLVFLDELRALMDGAYDLAALPPAPTTRARLERLAHDAAGAAREMLESTEQQLSQAREHGVGGDLELRIEVMRALARDAGEM